MWKQNIWGAAGTQRTKTMNMNGIFENLAMMGLGMTLIICVAWIVTNIVRSLKQRANTRTRADIYNRLIDKFGAAPEFIAFLQSDAGLRFIEENTVEPAAPVGRILTSMQIGIVLSLLGLGLLFIAGTEGSVGHDFYVITMMIGIVGLMIGIGLLVSAYVSQRLCKAWGILSAATVDKPAVVEKPAS